MASVLDFERYNADMNRQLLRRIGYTNGLHKVRRFARIVEYVHSIMPTSMSVLVEVVIREEKLRTASGEEGGRPLSGKKYAQGIVDVALALNLLEKFGPKIALSSQGYACHALLVTEREEATEAFLLEKVIEADGEYTLNILRLVAEGFTDALKIGQQLTERFLELIRFKSTWADSAPDRFSQRVLKHALSDAEKVLTRTIEKSDAVEFFFKHTVNPRLEWLADLGCLSVGSTDDRIVSPSGHRVLKMLKHLGGWHERFVFLPFDAWLASQLSIPNLYAGEAAEDFSWKLTAAKCAPDQDTTRNLDPLAMLDEVKAIYPHVKLANFNEADALSIYEVMASERAARGEVFRERDFELSLTNLLKSAPSEVFRLSKRRGRGQYVALKKPT